MHDPEFELLLAAITIKAHEYDWVIGKFSGTNIETLTTELAPNVWLHTWTLWGNPLVNGKYTNASVALVTAPSVELRSSNLQLTAINSPAALDLFNNVYRLYRESLSNLMQSILHDITPKMEI